MKKRSLILISLFALLLFSSIPQPMVKGFTSDSFPQVVGQEYIYEVTVTSPEVDFLNYTHFPSFITGDVELGAKWKVVVTSLEYTKNIGIVGYTQTYWDIVTGIVYNQSAALAGSTTWNTVTYGGPSLYPYPTIMGTYNGTNSTHPIPIHPDRFYFFFPRNTTAVAQIAMNYADQVLGNFPGAGGNWTPGPNGYDGIMTDFESSMIPDVWLWQLKVHVSGAIEYVRYWDMTDPTPVLRFSIDLVSINEPCTTFQQEPGDEYVWEATVAYPGNNLLSHFNFSRQGDIQQGELIKFEVTGVNNTNNIPGMDPTISWRKVEGKIYNSTLANSSTWTTTMWLGDNNLGTIQRAYGGAFNETISPSIPLQHWAWFFPCNGPAVSFIAWYHHPTYLETFNQTVGAGGNWTPGPSEYDGIMREFESSMIPDVWLWELKIHTTGAVEYVRYYSYNSSSGYLDLVVSLDLVSWPSAPGGSDAIMIVIIVSLIMGVAAAVIIIWRTKFS